MKTEALDPTHSLPRGTSKGCLEKRSIKEKGKWKRGYNEKYNNYK